MNYKLDFSGTLGDLIASLSYDGKEIASKESLKDGNAARKWAREAAAKHKRESAVASHTESVVVKGESTFSV